jgi:hypothetical protein
MKQSLKAEAECVDVWGGRRLRLESPILARMLVQAIQTFPAVANESKIETHTGLTIDFFSLIANSTDRQAKKTDAAPKTARHRFYSVHKNWSIYCSEFKQN